MQCIFNSFPSKVWFFFFYCIVMATANYWNTVADVPVCGPRQYHECVLVALVNYTRDNEAEACRCKRKCRRLTYHPTISQSELSTAVANYMKNVFDMTDSVDKIIDDHCLVEVCLLLVGYSSSSTVAVVNATTTNNNISLRQLTHCQWTI